MDISENHIITVVDQNRINMLLFVITLLSIAASEQRKTQDQKPEIELNITNPFAHHKTSDKKMTETIATGEEKTTEAEAEVEGSEQRPPRPRHRRPPPPPPEQSNQKPKHQILRKSLNDNLERLHKKYLPHYRERYVQRKEAEEEKASPIHHRRRTAFHKLEA